jgi:hypothetical protein
MATRHLRSILASEMVVGAHNLEWHAFISCRRRRRCAIEGLGTGRRLLLLSPSVTPKVRPPGPASADPSREGIDA